jgi:hypothetical protein
MNKYLPGPAMLVLASNTMKKNYIRYGDLLAFDILPHQLNSQNNDQVYSIGVFTVGDTSARLLLVGMAVLKECTVSSLCSAISLFFSIHGDCKTIIARNDPIVNKAIAMYAAKICFLGSHIFDL